MDYIEPTKNALDKFLLSQWGERGRSKKDTHVSDVSFPFPRAETYFGNAVATLVKMYHRWISRFVYALL